MRFPWVRAVVWALYLFISVCAVSAQQTTVNHSVSLRGDPSKKNPLIVHLNRNTTVTLLAAEPRGVQTVIGTRRWVEVKYLTVEGEAAAQPTQSPTPDGSTTAVTESTRCDVLWNHVYHKNRLTLIQTYTTVPGTVRIVRRAHVNVTGSLCRGSRPKPRRARNAPDHSG